MLSGVLSSAHAPSARLAPFVSTIQVMETLAPATRAVLPTPGLVVGFRYAGSATLLERGGERTLGNTGLTGVRTTLRRMRTSAGGGIVVVAFRTLGAARFFDEPLHELFGELVSLADLSARHDLAAVEERLALARSREARVAIVDEYLCRRLREREPDRVVAAAAAAIRARGGQVRIRALAKELGISQDPLEKRFRRGVGASPKQFASIVRFLGVVRGYEAGRSLTALAHECGYFDQPHLVRDFRAFTGEAPERFLRAREHC
jgi:AraC-like DNA-binding protein